MAATFVPSLSRCRGRGALAYPSRPAVCRRQAGWRCNAYKDLNDTGVELDVGLPAASELQWCSTQDLLGENESCDPYLEFQELRVSKRFVETFRMSSPYISAFRGSIFVIHVPGTLILENKLMDVMQDIALLHTVGVKLVLVLGTHKQVESRLAEQGIHDRMLSEGRETSEESMQVVKEAAGNMLFEVERYLSRGVYNAPVASRIRTCSGNYFSAKPTGVINGEDYGLSGKVRKVEVDALKRRLNEQEVVLLTNIGFSPSGEIYNCSSEEVAGECARQLGAEKIIFFVGGETVYSTKTKNQAPNLTMRTAKNFLNMQTDLPKEFKRYLSSALGALDGGVKRAHLLNRYIDGVLLMEIFHRDGVGLMVSRDLYEGIRAASLSDLPGIIDVIQPLEERGVLLPRPREQLEKQLEDFVVVERDGMVVACAALHVFQDDPQLAELACLAVHDRYRSAGKGAALLGYMERKALVRGVSRLFILSTQSFQWFMERGFSEAPIDFLPETKRGRYNHERKSKIFAKRLRGARAVDEEEILGGV